MAMRRMFSKAITNSSNFLMMSPSAQALYLHLVMNSDDDGYVELFAIMRMTESKPDDLQALHQRNLVYVFDHKVLIIKDWKEQNKIQIDRYTPSKYLAVYKEITDTFTTVLTECVQSVNKMLPQVSVGKVSVGKEKDNSASRMHESDFNAFWLSYPIKKGKKPCSTLFLKLDVALLPKILEAIKLQQNSEQWQKGFIPHPLTWISQARWDDEVKDILTSADEIERFARECVAKYGEEDGLWKFKAKYSNEEMLRLKHILNP